MSIRERGIPSDDGHDVAIVIPTVGGIPLLGCVTRLIEHQCGKRVHVVFSVNPLNPEESKQTTRLCRSVLSDSGLDVTWVESESAIGFGNAVNKGIEALIGGKGLPPVVVVLNDDTAPGPFWLDGLCDAFAAESCNAPSNDCVAYKISDYGRIGIVGPTSNYVWRDQRIEPKISSEEQIDQFCVDFRDSNQDNWVATEFISGFCMALSRELVGDLICADGWVFDPVYSENVGGFEDNDVCIRADHMGWRCLVAGQTYVHHFGSQTIGSMGIGNGLKNWPVHLKKWSSFTQREQTLGAVFRVKLDTLNDLLMFKSSLQGAAAISDSISILFTANPKSLKDAHDVEALIRNLSDSDRKWIGECDVPEDDEVAAASKAWVEGLVADCWHNEPGSVSVEMWGGGFNERDERNSVIRQSHQFSPDWIISIDHDEILESRVDREKIERLMKHPNPEVMAWDFAWMNHWNSPQYMRVDAPWGDGGRYTGSMRGFRMYRTSPSVKRVIVVGKENGLHCGNIPAFSVGSARVANMRFHHFGYMRGSDRFRKARRYIEIDPEGETITNRPDRMPYQHLVDETNMMLTPIPSMTGIAFSALVYNGENPADLVRVLDENYGLADSVTLVWTDPEDDTPGEDFSLIGRLFGVEWVRHKFEMDLSACRNAGLSKVREISNGDVGWLLTLDLDELFQSPFEEIVKIRRMAENPGPVAYMFNFINSLGKIGSGQQERSNASATIRMFRIAEELDLHWSGKVHETVAKSILTLKSSGVIATFSKAPFTMLHIGLNKSPEEIHNKLEKYAKMLVEEIEENPDDCMPWVSLALHFMNDGQMENALHCLHCGMSASRGDTWLPKKELAMHHLRIAKSLFNECMSDVPPSHGYRKTVEMMCGVLNQVETDFPYIGHAIRGQYLLSEVNKIPSVVPSNLRTALTEDGSGVE